MISQENIKNALRDDEFDYFYQPKVSLITGELVGAEALIRWIKPSGEIVSPGAFIPLAEERGLIKEITLYLFKKLKHSLPLIQEIKPLRISFNVTADDLETDELTEDIIDALKSRKLPPNSLEVEITESKLIKSKPAVKDNLNRIVGSGVGVSMDDFGSGYSSLNVLADYPFSALKLDYDLIKDIVCDNKKKFIAKTAIRMAHLLKIDVVAEGVENRQQYDLLHYMGCTMVQGFWISKPLPLHEFIGFIKKGVRFPGSAAGQIHMMFVDHLLWYRDFVYYAMSRSKKTNDNFSPRPITSHRQCRVGEWFYNEGKKLLAKSLSSQSLEEIEKIHSNIHDESLRLTEILDENCEVMHNQAHILDDFNRLHHRLIHKLQDCENSLVYDYVTA